MNLMKLGFWIAILLALPALLGRGGGGGGHSGGPPRPVDDYRVAAQRFLEAVNSNDPARYADVFSPGRRGRAASAITRGREMLRQQGRLDRVGDVRTYPGHGRAVLNAARGGWLLTLRLDGAGRIAHLQVDAL